MGKGMAAAAKYYAEKEFGESMNTHKEEKLGRVVVTQGEYKGLEGFACDYDPKKGTYNVDFNTGRTGPFHRIELAPLEPTPPSQIEEEPIRSLVEKWKEFTNQTTNEGFPMPVDNSFRGFMEWLEGEVR